MSRMYCGIVLFTLDNDAQQIAQFTTRDERKNKIKEEEREK